MKSTLFISLFLCAFFHGYSEEDIYLRQANIDIDNAQSSFHSAARKMKMDKGVKNLLLRFLSTGTDSLQDVIMKDESLPDDKKLLALNSHAYFLKAFQVSLSSGDVDEYHVRDLRLRYLEMWDAVRHDKPYDDIMNKPGTGQVKTDGPGLQGLSAGKKDKGPYRDQLCPDLSRKNSGLPGGKS